MPDINIDNNIDNSDINIRPPVVVVLGHVDHGKTRLLDTIRKTNVMGGESGGITQHIGAYQIEVSPSTGSGSKKLITFLDTPGHEAFSAIRSRGAKVADIAILVVAADESVKPQTKEAIRIINEEQIPVVVAINKIDKEGANIQKVKQDLASEGILVEEWGGKVPAVEISAKQGQNINELLDMILLVAELEELKSDTSLPAAGVVIESHLDKRRGYVATALVQKGILSLGDWVVAGRVFGKIKMMEDFTGKSVDQVKPSQPVILTGWNDAPETGVSFTATDSKSAAEQIAEENKKVTLSPLFSFLRESSPEIDKKVYNLILKSDVGSSLEAIEVSLKAIRSEEVRYNVVGYDIGDITENDIKNAVATKSDVVGFRVSVNPSVLRMAEKERVDIATFEVIYELIETIRKKMSALLEPEVKRTLIGRLKVIALFKKESRYQVVGGRVISGKMVRGLVADIVRSGEVVGRGKLGQLQHNKEDLSEVKEGLEAGLRVDFGTEAVDVKEGDVVECYEEEKIARSL